VEYYQTEAPEKYRSIYLSNTKIRSINEEISEYLKTHYVPHKSVDYYEQISVAISNLHLDLIANKEFDAVTEPFIDFTNFMEMVTLRINSLMNSREKLPTDSEEVFSNVASVYFKNVWVYPALVISKNTVTGLREKEIVKNSEQRIKDAKQYIDYNLQRLKSVAEDINLIPSEEDLKMFYKDSETGKNIARFWEICIK